MAFEILQPDVGSRMLKTFGTLSEENRKRQELSNKVQLLEQKAAQADFMERIRMGQLGIAQQRADQSGALGVLGLQLRQQAEQRLAQQAAMEMLKGQQKLDASAADDAAEIELAGLLNTKDESGLSLSQRLQSSDEKIAREAMQAFSEITGRYAGAGPKTLNHLKFTTDLLSKNRQDELARIREDRMAKSAEDTSAYRDRTQAERERHNRTMEAGKVGSAKMSEGDRTAISNFNRDIASAETQYRNFEKQRNATKNPAEKEKFLKQMVDMGNLAKELRDKRDALNKKYQGDLPAGLPEPSGNALFGAGSDLPPVPKEAVAPIAQPTIQAVPAAPQVAPPVVAPAAAPLPTPAEVNGLDFIFSRPAR